MSKITAEHLQRNACVYVRQSTPDQLVHNLESQRRQYGLADRAKQLGWTTVEIIDDDLGRSGGGIARPGFERLLAAICDGRVGAVLAIEASRLAATAATGTRSSSSVDWSAPSSSTRTESTILAIPTIGCCSG
jgi:DNA invertase Pin-like site-specific DNA recombinase